MKSAVFTIVAKNYIGLAQVLEKSVQTNADADFYIFVADEFDSGVGCIQSLPSNIIICKDSLSVKSPKWLEMSFKYNLVEFCTAIKPYCFEYLFQKREYSKVIYLDPDVYVFNSLKPILSDLDTYSIVLTPHILDMQTPFTGAYPDYLFLVNGTFNLGFLGLNNSTESVEMLSWWKHRLNDECFFDNDRGMATDQKWVNLLPAFFGREALHISKNRGLNVAPWNYHEREIVLQDNNLFVADRRKPENGLTPLIFVHFSGYDYKSFTRNRITHKNQNANTYPDLSYFFERYSEALTDDCFLKFISLPYSYNKYDNGKNIISLHRRIFRRLITEGDALPSPFSTSRGSFYERMSKRKLIDPSTSSADAMTNKTVPGFNQKIRWVNGIFRMIQFIVGVRRYSIFIRFFRRYFKEENQAFLFDKNFKGKLW